LVVVFTLLMPLAALADAADKNQELIRAVGKGNLAEATRLLNSGADVGAKAKRGSKALLLAAESGYGEIVRLLIARGADANSKTDNGWTALMAASERGHPEVVRLLLDNGADVNAKNKDGLTALIVVFSQHTFKSLFQMGLPQQVPHSNGGRLEVARLLLDKGADVNGKHLEGETPLMWATWDGDVDMVRLLIAKGAEVNARTLDYSRYAASPRKSAISSWTALGIARAAGYGEIEELLRARGAKE
jgi:ankyrin repeat protein